MGPEAIAALLKWPALAVGFIVLVALIRGWIRQSGGTQERVEILEQTAEDLSDANKALRERRSSLRTVFHRVRDKPAKPPAGSG